MAACIWSQDGNLGDRQAHKAVERFSRRSLILIARPSLISAPMTNLLRIYISLTWG